MKRRGIAFWVIGASLVMAATAQAASWKTYKDAWFDIKYPPGFKVIADKERFPDSARFQAPDGSVEFYVYSPQWNGEPDGISLDPDKERMKDDKTETKGDKQVRWYTIEAKDGSYCRSYVDTTDTLSNTRLVFGIKYLNEEALKKYQSDYKKFQDSLVQYAD
jgi:hypothetical protein